jgi:hypothetical protein
LVFLPAPSQKLRMLRICTRGGLVSVRELGVGRLGQQHPPPEGVGGRSEG